MKTVLKTNKQIKNTIPNISFVCLHKIVLKNREIMMSWREKQNINNIYLTLPEESQDLRHLALRSISKHSVIIWHSPLCSLEILEMTTGILCSAPPWRYNKWKYHELLQIFLLKIIFYPFCKCSFKRDRKNNSYPVFFSFFSISSF